MGSTTAPEISVFLIVCGILGMLLLAIGVIVFVLIYQKRVLAQKNEMHLLEVNFQKGLLVNSIEAQEKERTRLATDLHDGVGALLSATKLFVNQLSQDKPADRFNSLHVETKEMIDEVASQVRTITRDLIPVGIAKNGVVLCLEDLCHKISDRTALTIDFTYNEIRRINARRELAIYRIVQELLNNTLKYASADRVMLDMRFSDSTLEVTYQDDGVGFDYEEKKSKGLGLKNMTSRAVLLDTEIHFKSRPSEGMSAHFIINLTEI